MRFKNASFKTRLNVFVWPSAGVLSSNLIYEKLKEFKRQNGIYWNLNLTDFFSSDIISPPPTESVFSLTSYRPVCGCCWTLGRVCCFESCDNACSLFSFFPSCFMTALTISPGGKKKAILLKQFPFLAFIAFKVQIWQCLKERDKAFSFSHAAECHDVVDNGILAWDGLQI